MAATSPESPLDPLLARLRAGDPGAAEDLIGEVFEDLRQMARKLLNKFFRLRRFEQTDDVLQKSSLRLYRSLKEVTPDTARALYALAAKHIRRELLDMVKHHARNKRGRSASSLSRDEELTEPSAVDPAKAMEFAELQKMVEKLPADQKETLDLLYYNGLPAGRVGEMMGISTRQVYRLADQARETLGKLLGKEQTE